MLNRLGAGGIIIVAIILAGVTALLSYRWAADLKKNAKENWKPVVTAIEEVKARTRITSDMVQLTPIPEDLIAKDAVTSVESVVGRITIKAIGSKEQLRASDLIGERQSPSLAFEIPTGMRAIAIEASEVASVGTAVKPGDHVDVVATYHDPRLKVDYVKTILQNITVLAVNKAQTDPSTKEGANSSMTLVVKPEEAELLTAASHPGALRVMLRAMGDAAYVPTEGATVRDLGSGRMAIEETKTPAQPGETKAAVSQPHRTSSQIMIVRGTHEETTSSK